MFDGENTGKTILWHLNKRDIWARGIQKSVSVWGLLLEVPRTPNTTFVLSGRPDMTYFSSLKNKRFVCTKC